MWNGEQFREVVSLVRRLGFRSWLAGLTVSATIAAFFSAAGIVRPLTFYFAVALAAYCLSFVAFVLWLPQYRYKLLAFTMRPMAARRDPGAATTLRLVGAGPRPPLVPVALGRAMDRAYEAGFRELLADDERWIAVIPSSPRDVSRPHELVYPMFASGRVRTLTRFQPREFGIPLPDFGFERELSEGTHDTDHMLAVRDLIYLPHLYRSLGPAEAGDDLGESFVWPEHCADPRLLGTHNVVVVGGGDTNFWHAVLFEAVWNRFAHPPSTIPLALDFRQPTAAGGRYDSRGINIRLAGEVPGTGRGERTLDERVFPTYAMILGCDNPFSTRVPPHRCVFVAGTRSLGTGGAVLALAAIASNVRSEPGIDYWSLVTSVDDQVQAGVSALLCRVTRVETACRRVGGRLQRREERPIPTDRPDPGYSDTAIPTEVQFLDNRMGAAVWSTLVSRAANK